VDRVGDEVEDERRLGGRRLASLAAVIVAATGERDDGGERGCRETACDQPLASE
jgi:hypothetical protein